MLLAPDSSIILQELEGNREPTFNGPPMDTGRRRGSNSRLPSLATLVSASLILVSFLQLCSCLEYHTQKKLTRRQKSGTRHNLLRSHHAYFFVLNCT